MERQSLSGRARQEATELTANAVAQYPCWISRRSAFRPKFSPTIPVMLASGGHRLDVRIRISAIIIGRHPCVVRQRIGIESGRSPRIKTHSIRHFTSPHIPSQVERYRTDLRKSTETQQCLNQPALRHRGLNERRKQRMRLERPRLQLGVELHADEPGWSSYSTISGSTPSGDSPEKRRPCCSSRSL